jgi:hypothetical protein
MQSHMYQLCAETKNPHAIPDVEGSGPESHLKQAGPCGSGTPTEKIGTSGAKVEGASEGGNSCLEVHTNGECGNMQFEAERQLGGSARSGKNHETQHGK